MKTTIVTIAAALFATAISAQQSTTAGNASVKTETTISATADPKPVTDVASASATNVKTTAKNVKDQAKTTDKETVSKVENKFSAIQPTANVTSATSATSAIAVGEVVKSSTNLSSEQAIAVDASPSVNAIKSTTTATTGQVKTTTQSAVKPVKSSVKQIHSSATAIKPQPVNVNVNSASAIKVGLK